MQGWRPTTRDGVTRRKSTQKLKQTENLFAKNLQIKGVCQLHNKLSEDVPEDA